MERDRDDLPTPQPGDANPSGRTDAGSQPPSPFQDPPDEDIPPVEEHGQETEG